MLNSNADGDIDIFEFFSFSGFFISMLQKRLMIV